MMESWHSFTGAGWLNVMAFVKRSQDSTVMVARYGPLLIMLIACLGEHFMCFYKTSKQKRSVVLYIPTKSFIHLEGNRLPLPVHFLMILGHHGITQDLLSSYVIGMPLLNQDML